MIKKTVIHASEDEIATLIRKHISDDFDSIVAAEELGNQQWAVTVRMPEPQDRKDVKSMFDGKCWGQYKTRACLNILHEMGHLEAGEYLIDCTW